jgi:hypothetical protein
VASLDDADEVVTEWLYKPMTSALIGGRIDGKARLEWDDDAV